MLEKLFKFRAKPINEPKPKQGGYAAGLEQDYGTEALITLIENNHYLEEELIRRNIGVDQLKFLMDDDEIAHCWGKRSLSVQHRKWSISDPESQVSQFVISQLDKWYQQLSGDLLLAVMYGMSSPEVSYRKDVETGLMVPKHIIQHPTAFLGVDRGSSAVFISDEITGQQSRLDEHPIYKHKFFPVISNRTHERPAGNPLLLSLVWVWFLRSNVWNFWARYLERFGSPQWRGKAENASFIDPVTGQSNAQAMADMLEQAINSGVVVVGTEEEAEAINVTGNGGESFKIADDKINKRIQKRILGQTLTSESDGSGSYAMASVHDDVRQEYAASDIALIRPAIQSFVDSLVEINFPGQQSPVFDIEHNANLNEGRAERDTKLYGQGVRFSKDYFLSAYGFEAEEIEVDIQQPAKPNSEFSLPNTDNLTFAQNEGDSEGRKAVDGYIDDALEMAGSVVDSAALKAIIEKSKNRDDMIDRLEKHLANNDAESQFSEALEALLFAADVEGFEDANRGMK